MNAGTIVAGMKEDDEIAKEAPKVTLGQIEGLIRGEYYFNVGDAVLASPLLPVRGERTDMQELQRLTMCVLVLRNGFTVTGESACASLANFNQKSGEQAARANAISKVWALEGYRLKQQLHEGAVSY